MALWRLPHPGFDNDWPAAVTLHRYHWAVGVDASRAVWRHWTACRDRGALSSLSAAGSPMPMLLTSTIPAPSNPNSLFLPPLPPDRRCSIATSSPSRSSSVQQAPSIAFYVYFWSNVNTNTIANAFTDLSIAPSSPLLVYVNR